MEIDKPVLGKITQGSIFTAAIADGYEGFPIWGLCITARCDIAHDNKTDIFNYIPIVRFEDWLIIDGAKVILNRIYIELMGMAKGILKSKNKSETILDSYTPQEIANAFFENANGKEKDALRFHDIAEKIEKINELKVAEKINIDDIKLVINFNKKIADKVIKELWGNQMSGYYFVPKVGDTEHNSIHGFVALLREVRHIPRTIASSIAKGVSPEDLRDINNILKFSIFDFSYLTGRIASPWMEHIMQHFSMLFSRIGLPDQDKKTLEKLYEVVK